MKTFVPKDPGTDRKWYVIDACDQRCSIGSTANMRLIGNGSMLGSLTHAILLSAMKLSGTGLQRATAILWRHTSSPKYDAFSMYRLLSG